MATFSTIVLPIEGMTCAACSTRLQRALSAAEGVAEAQVNLATERATLRYDPAQTDVARLAEAVADAGYAVPSRSLRLTVTGMTCAACALRVEQALNRVDGVVSARVDAVTELATVAVRPGVPPELLLEAVRDAGYDAAPAPSSGAEREAEAARHAALERHELRVWALCAVLTLPLVAPMLGMAVGIHAMPPGWVQLALAAPVQALGGARFYRGAWAALRGGVANMDVLVALGTSAAFLSSLVQLGTGGHLYFEASASVITLVRLGKLLEGRARRSTSEALRALERLRPEVARLERDGQEQRVPVEAVAAGQVVVVLPGERVPLDGEVVEGHSDLDESLVTGEAEPVARGEGDRVLAGSLNGRGRLRVRVRGGEGTLEQLARLVGEAQARQPPVQKLVDRVSAVFVPVVLGLTALTLVGHLAVGADGAEAVLHAVAVLVIACPCALGLATPAALVAGTGAAAQRGILVRDGEALERARAVDVVLFDKTGTLTEGRPEVRRVFASGLTEEELLTGVAAVQKGSEHPLAGALLREAEARALRVPAATETEALVGRGIQGLVGGERWTVGSRRLAEERVGPLHDAEADGAEAHGWTVMWALRDDVVVGWIATGDAPREGAREAVATLRAQGIEVRMLTGDRRATAEAVARSLGIDGVVAEVLPSDKVAVVEAILAEGRQVAMVGDGVNDAPALAAATVGMAMSSGSDVAIHAAHIVLMRPDPRLVPDALHAARATLATIRQNLFFAFVYNVVGLPVAALGYLSPTWAGAAMALSSVSVVSNALRLRGLGRAR